MQRSLWVTLDFKPRSFLQAICHWGGRQMQEFSGRHARQELERIYAKDSRRVFATLVRLLGDFDLAEEATQDAFAAALEHWQVAGLPQNPVAWLISTGRFKGIDALRKETRFRSLLPQLANESDTRQLSEEDIQAEEIDDDTLRLIFTCCHPSLSTTANMALTLREVCGLSTDEIARAFLCSSTTVAQRIVRAKAKIRDARIPYRIPSAEDLGDRKHSVRRVIYLLFNEGYSATFGDSLTRPDLCAEAIRLGRLLNRLMPDSESRGLLALMLLHESRRTARTNAEDDIVLLEDQNRSLWNREQIEEAHSLLAVDNASRSRSVYWLQAAIASVHARASTGADTDWNEIVSLYDQLILAENSPVVALNRAVAVAMRDGPQPGLVLLDEISQAGVLDDYYLLHSARAELLRRSGRFPEAHAAYDRALQLTCQGAEVRFLRRRRESLPSNEDSIKIP